MAEDPPAGAAEPDLDRSITRTGLPSKPIERGAPIAPAPAPTPEVAPPDGRRVVVGLVVAGVLILLVMAAVWQLVASDADPDLIGTAVEIDALSTTGEVPLGFQPVDRSALGVVGAVPEGDARPTRVQLSTDANAEVFTMPTRAGTYRFGVVNPGDANVDKRYLADAAEGLARDLGLRIQEFGWTEVDGRTAVVLRMSAGNGEGQAVVIDAGDAVVLMAVTGSSVTDRDLEFYVDMLSLD